MKRFLLGMILFGTFPAAAETHQEALAKLRENEKRISENLSRLGISSAFGNRPPESSKSQQEESPLFRVHGDLKSLKIAPGRIVFGKILNRMVVGSEAAPVLIEITETGTSLTGLRLIGKARQSSTEGRLILDFDRLLLPQGEAIAIQATALDHDGAYGLEAQVLSGKVLAVAGAMASSFISGLAASQQTQTINPFGFSQTQTTGRNAMLQGVAQTAADQSKRLIEESTSEKPVLIVNPETPVSVLFNEGVRF